MPESWGTVLQGDLDVFALKIVSREPLQGYGIARWVQRTTDEALQLEEVSLHPALYRVEHRGWLNGA